MRAVASLGMSDVTAVSSRSSIWNTTWTCCTASPAHWPARGRWNNSGVRGLAGELRSDLGSVDHGTGKQSGTKQMIGLLKLGQEHGRERLRTASRRLSARFSDTCVRIYFMRRS